MSLVGRAREESVFAECLAAVLAGAARTLAITGDPGTGKSSLLTALTERAERAGLLVLSGRVGEFGRSLPFGVVVDALDDHLAARSDLWTAGLSGCFPAVREICSVLAALGAERGVVLALDDLHWADPSSLELVNHLVRHQTAGVLLACPYRPRQLLDGLNHSADVHLSLAPLRLEDTGIKQPHTASRGNHPTVRNVAYHSATATSRCLAHTRADVAFERRGAPAEIRAHHIERAARRGDGRAVSVFTSTANTAAEEGRIEPLWGRARALGLSGRLADSRQALHELLAVLPSDHTDRLRIVVFCAHIEWALGGHAEVRALAARELATMDTSDLLSAAVLKLVLAVSLLQVMESPEVICEMLDEVLLVARGHRDRVLEAGALAMIALTLGDKDNCLRRAAEAVDGATDRAVAERLESVVWLGWGELRLGRYQEALRHYERALAVAEATGQHHMLGTLLLGRANALRWLGCLAEAEAGAEVAAEAAFLSGSDDLHALALAEHSWLLTLRGEAARGLTVAHQAIDVARSIEGWHSTIARLRAVLAAGDGRSALLELRSAGGGRDLPKVPPSHRPEFCELVVQTAIQTGAVEEAADWAEAARISTEGSDLDGCLGFAALAMAQVHAARGEFADAVVLASEAAARFESAGQRLEVGRAHLVRGKALAAQGKSDSAAADIRHAQGLFAVCGAPPYADAEIVKSARTTASPLLTKREQEVADLVCEGLTNRQVSRRLEMAEKTVEGHLSRIFTKLAVRSRAGLLHRLSQHP